MALYKAGQFIRFVYQHPPEGVDAATGDRYKEVFVLNPQWLGEMHGIDLKRLTMAEREVLVKVFDPKTVKGKSDLPLVNDILRRMDPRREITNPMAFYQKFVKPFLQNKDAYRRYKPARMRSVTVTRQSTVLGMTKNPKPLFHKTETKPQQSPFGKTGPQTGQQPGKGSEHGQVKKFTPDQLAAMAKQYGVKMAPPKQSPTTKLPLSAADRMAAMKSYQAKKKK